MDRPTGRTCPEGKTTRASLGGKARKEGLEGRGFNMARKGGRVKREKEILMRLCFKATTCIRYNCYTCIHYTTVVDGKPIMGGLVYGNGND